MPSCAVFGCKINSSNSSEIRFHRFPKEKRLAERWIHLCKRKDKFRTDNSRVCSQHFAPEDYERDLRSELLNLPQKPKLKAAAVPHLNLPKSSVSVVSSKSPKTSSRSQYLQKKQAEEERRRLVEEALRDAEARETQKTAESAKSVAENRKRRTPKSRTLIVETLRSAGMLCDVNEISDLSQKNENDEPWEQKRCRLIDEALNPSRLSLKVQRSMQRAKRKEAEKKRRRRIAEALQSTAASDETRRNANSLQKQNTEEESSDVDEVLHIERLSSAMPENSQDIAIVKASASVAVCVLFDGTSSSVPSLDYKKLYLNALRVNNELRKEIKKLRDQLWEVE